MTVKHFVAVLAIVLLVVGGALAFTMIGGGIAFAQGGGDNGDGTGGSDNSGPIIGDALDKARAAALAYTGGGQATETEVGDEEGYYEVEVVLADGRQVDVHLDRDFNVLNSQGDRDALNDASDK